MTSLLVPGLFVTALALASWFELRRAPEHRRTLRVVSAALIVASLFGFIWLQGPSTARQVLTPGAPVTSRSREAIGLERLSSPALLWSGNREVRLSGWGLLAHEWPDSLETRVTLDAAPLPQGIVALDVPTEIGLGEQLVVTGQLNLAGTDSVWVLLDDPAGVRDSMLTGRPSLRFRVTDWPRAATGAEYRIRIRAAGETIVTDTFGVAVRETRPPGVLLLDGSPNFESTFLKRWLAGRGGMVTVRTAISRERYRTEQAGPQIAHIAQIAPIGSGVLARYDAVLIDGGALRSLSASESAALVGAVTREGLGLLVTADVKAAAESKLTSGLIGMATGEEDWSLKPQWSDAPRRSSIAILTESVQLAPGNQVLVRDPQGRLLATSRSLGNGRVGVTLLKSPSRWMLEGEQDLYGSYWQLLLTAIARDTVTRVAIAGEGARLPDQPLTVTLTIPDVRMDPRPWPSATVRNPKGGVDTLPFARDPFDARLWRSTYWPTTSGWHTLQLTGGRSVPFRVNHQGEWTGIDAAARRVASVARLGPAAQPAAGPAQRVPVQLLLFLAIVGLLTWLWVEPRIRRS